MSWQSIKNIFSKPLAKILFLAIAFLALISNFCYYSLSGGKEALISRASSFKRFQDDSEGLVYGKIIADAYFIENSKNSGLFHAVSPSAPFIATDNLYSYLADSKAKDQLTLSGYTSQTGLQGYTISFLFNKLHMPIYVIKLIITTLLTTTLLVIIVFIGKRYSLATSIVSFFCFLLSPWICAFARNLYWVEFTWFLPILFSLVFCAKKKKIIPFFLIFLSALIKCLCGFEYITVIFSMVALIPLLDSIICKKSSVKTGLKNCVLCATACILSFVIAIGLQSAILGQGNLASGFSQYYESAVSKRVLGGSSAQESLILQESLKASPFTVVSSYFDWDSDIITGITGKLFGFFVLVVITILLFSIILNRKDAKTKLLVFLLLFLSNVSWFFLVSPHSYIHHHMNYVLWYFGLVQYCFYIIVDFLIFIAHSMGLPSKKEIKAAKQVPDYNTETLKEKNSDYCLCIPIINEGERIIKELKRAKKANIQKYVDIIICDGGSTDGSIEEIKKLGIRAIITKTGAGKQGAQLRTGFDFAIKQGYLGIVTIDGNNKDSIEDVPKFIKKLKKGYDFVQGSRFIKGGKAINTPFYRTIAVRTLHAPLISLTAWKKYTDTTNAYRAYSMRYLKHKKVKPFRDIFSGYELLAYLSVRADQLGLKTCEIPVTRAYPSKGKTPTKISPLRGNITLFSILLKNAFGAYDPKGTE